MGAAAWLCAKICATKGIQHNPIENYFGQQEVAQAQSPWKDQCNCK
jgi:hypothetical protein